MPIRQVILFKPIDPGMPAGGMSDLGSLGRVVASLEPFNIAPDGSIGSALGTVTLHGPGLVVDLPSSTDELTQVMVTVVEDETAWPVLARMCRELGWKMMDTETGRTFM